MTPAKCLIVDDEPVARRIIESYIEEVPGLAITGSCQNAMEALEYLHTHSIHLMFLDIEMPRIKGLDFLRSIPHPPAVILTTAHREFALDGFELGVVDYLLKPISFERFLKAISRFRGNNYQPVPLESNEPQKDYILLKSDRKLHRVFFTDIHYIEGLSNYVRFHLADNTLIVYNSLTSLTEELPPQFVRIHRSYIVNTQKVMAFDPEEVQLDDINLPIGGAYREMALKFLKE